MSAPHRHRARCLRTDPGDPAVDHRQRVLREHGEPSADLCAVRALDQHDARLWRDGVAGPRRISRHCRLRLHPRHGRRLRPTHCRDLRPRPLHACSGFLRRAVAASARSRLHHDHAGARSDRMGRSLPGQQSYRRGQRNSASRPADAVRLRYPGRFELLLFHAYRVRDRPVFHLAFLAFGLRRQPHGHPRSAPAHAHARAQRVADPTAHFRHGRLLGLGRQPFSMSITTCF